MTTLLQKLEGQEMDGFGQRVFVKAKSNLVVSNTTIFPVYGLRYRLHIIPGSCLNDHHACHSLAPHGVDSSQLIVTPLFA